MTGAELLAWLQALSAEELELPVTMPEEGFVTEFLADIKVQVREPRAEWPGNPKRKCIVIEREN